MHTSPRTTSETSPNSCSSSSEVRSTIRRGIESPLRALSASLEEMGKEFPEGTPQSNSLEKAQGMIETIGRNVQLLSALAAPADFVPLRCTMDELARSAVRATSSTVRERIFFAVESPDVFTKVDGPSFSRWLSHLLHASVIRRGEALLRAQVDGDSAVFTLLSQPTTEPCGQSIGSTQTFRRQEDELLMQVAEQEISRMGGSLELLALPHGTTQVTARLPLETQVEGAA